MAQLARPVLRPDTALGRDNISAWTSERPDDTALTISKGECVEQLTERTSSALRNSALAACSVQVSALCKQQGFEGSGGRTSAGTCSLHCARAAGSKGPRPFHLEEPSAVRVRAGSTADHVLQVGGPKELSTAEGAWSTALTCPPHLEPTLTLRTPAGL